MRRLSLQGRLTLLLAALVLPLVPLGAFTVREAREAARVNLREALLTRLGFYSAVTPNDLATLAAISNEFGGFGFLYQPGEAESGGETAEESVSSASEGALRFTDTGGYKLPESVQHALEMQVT